MTALDVEALRLATPGCNERAHFNTAGAGLVSQATLAVISDHLRREALDGPMEVAAATTEAIETARGDAAALIGAAPGEVAFASSGSMAWGLAFAALPPLAAGDRVLVGRHEWGGNLASLTYAAECAGAQVEVIPCTDDGSVDAAALANMIDARVRLVSLTWLPANGGLINDAAAVGRVTRAADVPYYLDAGQAVGQIPVDVRALGCDVLKSAGRKHLRGPRGTAILYVREAFQPRLRPAFLDVLSAPWKDGAARLRADGRRFETSEQSVALLLGLGVALREALRLGAEPIQARVTGLAQTLRQHLSALPGVTIQDLGRSRSGLVSFTVEGLDAGAVRARLAIKRITVGANPAAYTPLDMAARGLADVVRASLTYLNTQEEVEKLAETVGEIAAGSTR